jgi:hypothetical protein
VAKDSFNGHDHGLTQISHCAPKEVGEKLHRRPRQRLHVIEKGGIITLVPEVPLKLLKGALKGMSKTDLREKKGRS